MIQVGQLYTQEHTTHKYTMKILEVTDDSVKWVGVMNYIHDTNRSVLEKFIQNDGWVLQKEESNVQDQI